MGDATTYGSSTTYRMSLDGYIHDKPYEDKSPGTAGRLDPIGTVQDQNDNGTDDRVKGEYESGLSSPCNSCLRGDLVQTY